MKKTNLFPAVNDRMATPKTDATPAQGDRRRRTRLLALEPRYLFDGVALTDATLDTHLNDIVDAAAAATHADSTASDAQKAVGTATVTTVAITDADTSATTATATSTPSATSTHELMFVDPAVANNDSLTASLKAGVEVIVLDATRDGVQQISEALAGRQDVNAIYIVSHGAAGELHLAASDLTLSTLQSRLAELAAWRQSLSTDADILLYGCDIASGDKGAQFIATLAQSTGADVAASTDATGAAARGGDWVLEAQTGAIEAKSAFAEKALATYDGLLNNAPVIGGITASTSINDTATATPFAGVTISDADATDTQTLTVTLDNSAKGSLSNLSGGTFTNGVYTFNGSTAAAQAAIRALVFTPTANRVAPGAKDTTTFTISVKDAGNATATNAITKVVSTSINDAPTAVADTVTIAEDSASVTGNVLTNDSDADSGDSKSVTAFSLGSASGALGSALVGAYGRLTLNADGSYSYAVDNTIAAVQALGVGEKLTETFSYTMKDAAGVTSSSTLTVTIDGTNDVPALTPGTTPSMGQKEGTTSVYTVGTLLEPTTGSPLWTDADSATTTMGIAITGAPTTDAASGMTGTWYYHLGSDATGVWHAIDSAALSTSNALLLAADAQVKFVVNESASNDSQNSGVVLLSYAAWDGSSGTQGTTAAVTSSATSAFSSATLTAEMNVTPDNDAPTFSASTLTVNEHGSVHLSGSFTSDSTQIAALTGNLRLYDADNSTAQILYRVEQLPAHGTLALNGAVLAVGSLFAQTDVANIVYTPTLGELTSDATDSVYFSIRDGAGGVIGADGVSGTNAWARLDIVIKDVNAQIAVSGNNVTLTEDNSGAALTSSIALSMSDADDAGSLATLTLTSLPSVSWGTLQYWNSASSSYQDVTAANYASLTFTQAQLTDTTHPALRFSYKNSGEPSSAYNADGTPATGSSLVSSLTTSFTVHVSDKHATLTPTTADTTVTITVNAVNDVPVLTTSPLTVDASHHSGVAITDSNLITSDPDSAVANRVYTVRTDPTQGYLTLNNVRIGRSSTFTEADLTSGKLVYVCNGTYSSGSDSLEVFVSDGDGGKSNAATLTITIESGSGGGGSGGSLQAVVSEGLYVTIGHSMLQETSIGEVFTVTGKPAHGDVYLNGVKVTYGTTTFTQADIDAGKVVYWNDGSEPSTYSTAYHETIALTATLGGSTRTISFDVTVAPVDDAPTISQTPATGSTLSEQNADGTDGRTTANYLLSNVTNAAKLTTANFTAVDSDNSESQLTYVVESVVGGVVARWNGSSWETVSQFSVADLVAGNIAYFHSASADVANPGDTTMTGSVSVYLVDGATIETGDVTIAGGHFSEGSSQTVSDGSTTIHITRDDIARSPTRTVTFTINDVNDAPVASDTNFTVTEYSSGISGQTSHIQVLDASLVAASDSDTANTSWTYTLTALPTYGRIEKWDGSAWQTLAVNATFTYAELAAGKLRYVNTGGIVADASTNWSLAKDSFAWKVNDGETGSATHTLDSTTGTVSVFLRPTNQPPVVTGTLTDSVPEGGATKITVITLGDATTSLVDVDNSNIQVQYRITDVSGLHGTLYLGNASTGTVTKALGVGSAFTLADLQAGRVWYQHDGSEASAYANTATFGFAISDASGMTEPNGIVTITIVPVNDAPVVGGLAGGATFTEGDTSASPNVTPILIDSSVTLTDSDLANNGTSFTGGTLTIHFSSGGTSYDQLGVQDNGTAAGVIGYSGGKITYGGVEIGTASGGTNGTDLVITLNASANVAALKALIQDITFSHTNYDNALTGTRTLSYTLVDGGGTASYTDDRGRTFDGHDTWTGSATVVVAAANDRPVLTDGNASSAISLGTISEDTTSNPTSWLVSSFLAASADTSHSGIIDVDTGALQGIAITSVSDAATGHWEYSADGTTWTSFGTVSETSALLLPSTYSVRFVPDAKDGGTATFTYKAWDRTSGSAGAKADTTATAAKQTSAFSTGTDQVSVSVTPINDAPTIGGSTSSSATVSVSEDVATTLSPLSSLALIDVDSGSHQVMMTLTLTGSGTFGFSSATAGVSTAIDGSGSVNLSGNSGTLTLYGSASALNTALGKLQYLSAANVNKLNNSTAPTLKVDVSDLGWGTDGTQDSALTASKTLTIDITAVNDKPTLTLGGSATLSVNQGATATPVATDITLIDAADIGDSGYAAINSTYLVVSAHNGVLTFAAASGVTIVSGDGTATLTLRGTLADLTAALSGGTHSLSYTPATGFSGSDTLTLTLHDAGNSGSGGDKTDVKTIAVSVSGDNEAPSFSGLAGQSYTEDGAAFALAPGATIGDPELSVYGNWGNAVLTLVRSGGANSEDIFGLTGSGSTGVNFSGSSVRIGTTAVGSFTNSGGQLQITFAEGTTNDQANQVLQAITYRNTSNDPAASIRIDYTIDDGDTDSPDRSTNGQGTGGHLSGNGYVTIAVTCVNDAPTVTTSSGNAAFVENAATPTVIDAGLALADADDTQLTGATVTISGNFLAGDTLGFVDQNGISGSYDSATGILTLSGAATKAAYQTALRSVTFTTASDDPTFNTTKTTRTITFAVTDENSAGNGTGALSGSATRTITVTPTQDAPVLAGGGATLAYTEQGTAAVIDATVVVSSDADDTQLAGATVTISSGYTTGDVLAFTNQNGITGSYNAGTHVLTLTGKATLADYQAALRTVKFSSTSDDPTATSSSRTISWRVTDANSDAAGAASSNAVTSTIAITAVNDAPTLTGMGSATYTENGAAVALFSGIALTDADDANISSATVTIGNFVAGDTLNFSAQNGITGSYDAASGILTLSGTATQAYYQTALRSITFSSTSDDPTVNATATSRDIRWTVTDANSDGVGAKTSVIKTSTLTVVPAQDKPVMTAGGTLVYAENDDARIIDATVAVVSDADDTQMAGASVTISSGYTAGDTLVFTAQNGISGSYDSATGVLTLTGTATLADYQSALRSVGFSSTSNDPTATSTTRTISWQVTDANSDATGAATSTAVTSTITITPVNDAPLAVDDTASITENTASVAGNVKTGVGGTLDSDPDNNNAQLSVAGARSGSEAAGGAMTGVSAGTSSANGTTIVGLYGTLTIGADGSYVYTLDNGNAAVNALRTGETLNDTFSYRLADPGALTDIGQLTITIDGTTDGGLSITPHDGNGSATGEADVYERGLVDGDASQTVGDTVTLTAADGIASVMLGGTSFTVAQLAAFSTSNPSAEIDTGEGTLCVTGFSVKSGPDSAPTAATLTYRYTLKAALTHTGASESTDAIALVVTDATSAHATATGTLTLRIVDDIPTARDDAHHVSKGTTGATTSTSGNVVSGTTGGDVADRLGADTTATPVTAVAFAGDAKIVGTGFASAYGTLTLNADGSYTYSVDSTNATVHALKAGESLSETFSYTLTDADGDTSTVNLTITIDGANDAPVAHADAATAIEAGGLANGIPGSNATGNVLANDTAGSNIGSSETKTVTVGAGVRTGTYGTLTLNADGSFTYVVDESNADVQALRVSGQTLSETFSYTMANFEGATSASTLTVTIDGRNDTPVARNDSATTTKDNVVTGNVLANDSDVDSAANGETLSVASFVVAGDATLYIAGQTATIAGRGTLSIAADGRYSFTPLANYSGDVPLVTYTLRDTAGASASATLTLNVTPVTDKPIVELSDVTINEDGTATLSIVPRVADTLTDDLGGEHLTQVTLSGVPSGVTLSLADGSPVTLSEGVATLNPAQLAGLKLAAAHDYSGTITLTVVVRAQDGRSAPVESDPQRLTVTIKPVSDTPILSAPDAVRTDVDTPVTLAIGAAQTDTDASEVLSIRISDIPAGAQISANGVAVTIVNGQADIAVPASGVVPSIVLTPPLGSDVSFVLRVTSVAKDGDADEAVTTRTLAVNINALPLPLATPTNAGSEVTATIALPDPGTASTTGSGRSSGSDGAMALSGETRLDDASSRLSLRAGLPAMLFEQAGQESGADSRKLESTDRGFPVERIQASATTVQDQQKGADRLFVLNGIRSTTTQVGQPLSYTVAKDAFGHTNTAAIVQLEAILTDGSPLPEWMDFDPTSGTFSGRPPANTGGEVEVKVTARDDQGREVSTNFKLQIEGAREQGRTAERADRDAQQAGKQAAQRMPSAKRGSVPFSDQLKLSRRDALVERLLTRPGAGTLRSRV